MEAKRDSITNPPEQPAEAANPLKGLPRVERVDILLTLWSNSSNAQFASDIENGLIKLARADAAVRAQLEDVFSDASANHRQRTLAGSALADLGSLSTGLERFCIETLNSSAADGQSLPFEVSEISDPLLKLTAAGIDSPALREAMPTALAGELKRCSLGPSDFAVQLLRPLLPLCESCPETAVAFLGLLTEELPIAGNWSAAREATLEGLSPALRAAKNPEPLAQQIKAAFESAPSNWQRSLIASIACSEFDRCDSLKRVVLESLNTEEGCELVFLLRESSLADRELQKNLLLLAENRDFETQVRAQAVQLLGPALRTNSGLLAKFKTWAADENSQLRVAAGGELGALALENPGLREPLLWWSHYFCTDGRRAFTQALAAGIGQPDGDALLELISALDDGNPAVRYSRI